METTSISTVRKLILYIAASLDGYIAGPDDDLSFLSFAEQEGEDYGYAAFLDSVDTIIVGRKTYDKVTSMGAGYPPAGKEAYVISRSLRPDRGTVRFYSGDLRELVGMLKTKSGKNIYCDGGAETVTSLLQSDLIDELIITVLPILIGNGTRLFKDGRPEQMLKLISSKQYAKGLIQLHYIRV